MGKKKKIRADRISKDREILAEARRRLLALQYQLRLVELKREINHGS